MTVAWHQTLLCTCTRSICSPKTPVVGGNLLLNARCLQNRNNMDLNTFLNYTIRIHSWPICLSTPALDGRLHLVVLVLWLCSFQPWCIVESITFYLLLRIDRHCQTVFPVNAWNTGNVVALSLPSALQIGQTSFIPGGVFVELVIDNNSKNWDICIYGKTSWYRYGAATA